MTRHAEMERPDEVQEAEFAAQAVIVDGTRFVDLTDAQCWWLTEGLRRENRFEAGKANHRRGPYSRLRERNIFDPAHEPRHVIRKHRAEVAG